MTVLIQIHAMFTTTRKPCYRKGDLAMLPWTPWTTSGARWRLSFAKLLRCVCCDRPHPTWKFLQNLKLVALSLYWD